MKASCAVGKAYFRLDDTGRDLFVAIFEEPEYPDRVIAEALTELLREKGDIADPVRRRTVQQHRAGTCACEGI